MPAPVPPRAQFPLPVPSSRRRMQKLPWVSQHPAVTAAGGKTGDPQLGETQCWPHLGGPGCCLAVQRLLGEGAVAKAS